MIDTDDSARRWLGEYAVSHALSLATEQNHQWALNAFEKWIGRAASIHDVAERINDFVRHRAAKYSPHGVRSQRGVLVTLLRFAESEGRATVPRRIRNVVLTDVQPTWFSDAELLALLAHASPIQRAAILVVRCGAMRRGDVLWRLRWSHIGADGVLRWVMAKPGRRHAVQLTTEAIDACRLVRSDSDERLLPWTAGKGSWHYQWKRLGRIAGVNVHRRQLQAIRRVASSMVAKEFGEVAAAKLLGHSASSGVLVFRKFYAVGSIVDEVPPSPQPLKMEPFQ